VIDHLDEPDHFRLRAAIVGRTANDSLALREQLGAWLATAWCP
jgi:hypothetical protein